MSQSTKPAGDNSSQSISAVDVDPKERERVAQFIAAKNSGAAVDFAKDVHKRRNNAASEALLVDAYGARVASLLERDLKLEAAALVELIRGRYPESAARMTQWNVLFPQQETRLSSWLAPLNDPTLAAETQAAIMAKVRREVDLKALAECEALAADHPLRTGAAALQGAFEAVTSGPVADEALALPEVSRSSPLAPWKMLVRAIGAYYRHDDGLCERCVAAIDPQSAAARLAPALRALLHTPQNLTPAATSLVNQVGANLDSLRDTLKRLDSALGSRNKPAILRETREAVEVCRKAEPGLLERIKQHISIRARMAGVRADKMVPALGGHSLKNAYFWRLLARSYEENKEDPFAPGHANAAWEEFRKHATREGWLPSKGPELSALYLHMADQLRHFGPDDLDGFRSSFERRFDGFEPYYSGQPPEIRALKPTRSGTNLYYLLPYTLLGMACQVDPTAQNFERCLRYGKQNSLPDCDYIAEVWSAALPHDIPPLLHLMQSAEERNALQKAFKLMERAEKIDGVNVEVRRARLRLLVSIAVRHLRAMKPKLAEKDLAQIEALPQSQQGDRPALVAALRYVWCNLCSEPQAAVCAYEEAARFLGDGITAYLLFLQVEQRCGQPSSKLGNAPRPTVPLFAALGRVCSICEEFGILVAMVKGMPEQITKELLATKTPGNPSALAALGEVAMREKNIQLAYTISGAGLAQGAEYQARFLFLRARSLPGFDEKRRALCLAAASELARRHHEAELMKRIGEFRVESFDWLDVPGQARAAMDTEEVHAVVQHEIGERGYPQWTPDLMDEDDDKFCQCPACSAKRGKLPVPDGIPQELLPPEMLEMLEAMGPELFLETVVDMMGVGKKKRGSRRRTRITEDDLPF